MRGAARPDEEHSPQPILDKRGPEVLSVARKGAATAVEEWARHYTRVADDVGRLSALARKEKDQY